MIAIPNTQHICLEYGPSNLNQSVMSNNGLSLHNQQKFDSLIMNSDIQH